MNNGEPISDGAPVIYTERKDGVLPEYNIRTDRMEIAVEGMDKVAKSHTAKREERMKGTKIDKNPEEGKDAGKKDGGAEPIQGTGDQSPK